LGDVTVPSTVTLTIEPGVSVLADSSYALEIEGHLDAQGTTGQTITFTWLDSGPTPTLWGGIRFSGGTGHLRHATVSHARHQSHPCAVCIHNVDENGDQVVMEHTTVTNNPDHGVEIFGSRVHIHSCTFSHNGETADDAGLYVSGTLYQNDDPTLGAVVQYSHFDNNAGYGIYTDQGARLTLLFTNSADGNGVYPVRTQAHNLDDVLNGGNSFQGNTLDYLLIGQQDEPDGQEWGIATDVVFNNANGLSGYELEDTISITQTGTLTVENGLRILGRSGATLEVEGHLAALGTADHEVVFSAQNGTPGGWGGILFWGQAGGGTGYLRHTTVEYGQGSQACNLCVIHTTAGEVVLEHATLSGALDHGLNAMNSHVVLQDTLITGNGSANGYPALNVTWGSLVTATRIYADDNAGWGISVDGNDASFHMAGGSISGNGDDGLRVYNGSPTVVISQTEIMSNTGHGVDFDGTGGITLRHCRISHNGELGVRSQNPSSCLDAAGNWWGDVDGPNDASSVDDGCMGGVANASAGEGVSDDVRYTPWVGGVTTMTLAGETMGASLAYTDAHGLASHMVVPPGALTETAVLVYTPLPTPGHAISNELAFGGWAFDVTPHGGGGQMGALAAPVTVTLHYSVTERTVDEASLRLYRWTGTGWQDVVETCSPPSSYQRDPDLDQLQVEMCHLSEYALLGEAPPTIFLPLTLSDFRNGMCQ
jgi:hypothetical protein